MDITPKDSTETRALGIGRSIATAIGILVAAASGILAVFGDLKWITDNLPLLGTGLGSLATGGLAAYVAVRRMRLDRPARGAGLLLLLLLPALILSGCLTRTRCQQIDADTVNITINLNDPESMSENAYPRTLNILAQDQQVEGGTDSIASGNTTPVSTLPIGDKAIEAAASVAGSAISKAADKVISAATSSSAATAAAATAAACADCSDTATK